MKKALTITLALILCMALFAVTALAADSVEVSTEEELVAALESGAEAVTVTKNITLTDTLEIKHSVVLDLDGHTLTYDQPDPVSWDTYPNDAIYVETCDGVVEIKNGEIVAVYGEDDEPGLLTGIFHHNGALTLRDLTVTADRVAINVMSRVDLIENCVFQAYEYEQDDVVFFNEAVRTDFGADVGVIRDSEFIGVTYLSGFYEGWYDEETIEMFKEDVMLADKLYPTHVELIENCEFSYPLEEVDMLCVEEGAVVDRITGCTLSNAKGQYGASGLVVYGELGSAEDCTFNWNHASDPLSVGDNGKVGSITGCVFNINCERDEEHDRNSAGITVWGENASVGAISDCEFNMNDRGNFAIYCEHDASIGSISDCKVTAKDFLDCGFNLSGEIGSISDCELTFAVAEPEEEDMPAPCAMGLSDAKVGPISGIKSNCNISSSNSTVESISDCEVSDIYSDADTVGPVSGLKCSGRYELRASTVESLSDSTVHSGIYVGSSSTLGDITDVTIEEDTLNLEGLYYDEEGPHGAHVTVGDITGLKAPGLSVFDATVGDITDCSISNLNTLWWYFDADGKLTFPENVIGDITNLECDVIDFGGEYTDEDGNMDITVYNTVGDLTNVTATGSITLRSAVAGDLRGCSSEDVIWFFNTTAGVVYDCKTPGLVLEHASLSSVRGSEIDDLSFNMGTYPFIDDFHSGIDTISGNTIGYLHTTDYPDENAVDCNTIGEISGNTFVNEFSYVVRFYGVIGTYGENSYEISPNEDGSARKPYVNVDGRIETIIGDGKIGTYTDGDAAGDEYVTDDIEIWTEPNDHSSIGEVVPPVTASFTDVAEGAWYADVVDYAISHGLMNGTGTDTFSPTGSTSRAMVFTILARNAGVDTAPDEGETWYQKGLEWAVSVGMSDGSDPTGDVTREQLATMLWRLVGEPEVDDTALDAFPDADTIHDWTGFHEAMAWAVSEGIITGSDGKLDPLGTSNRAVTATMLMRFIEKGFTD